jgi:hypothetical protein
MKKYQYQLIRYVHDHFTGEYVNVGVVVYSKDERFLVSRTTSRVQRIKHMFPEASGRWIIRVLSNFNNEINRVSEELNELFTPSDSLEQITSSILIQDNGAIQLTATMLAIDIDLKAATHDLYTSQVEKYIQTKVDKNTLLDEDVWRTKYKTYFEKYGIDKRLKTHDVKVPKDVISFQKSWKNKIWHCYEPLSFVLQEKDSIKDKVYKWAGRLQGLQHANETLHLTLMTSISPQHKDLKAFIFEYLKLDTDRLKVDIITDDKAETLAKEVHRKMELHDKMQ